MASERRDTDQTERSGEERRLLPIVQAGHPVLREPARPLTRDELASPDIQALIRAMRDTMRAAPGVGLAAPQVGVPLRLAVIEDPATGDAALLAARERRPVPFHVIVNPRLTPVGDERVSFLEGCLSVTGFCAQVPRHCQVRVEAWDERGEPVTLDARGWYARILQHECDHLDGTLYVDRMDTRTFADVRNVR